MSIAILIMIINTAIANNTISILIVAPVARKISEIYHITSTHIAAILDISSCIVQGILPYGAQILLLIKLIDNQRITYSSLVSQSYYIGILALFTLIYFGFSIHSFSERKRTILR